MGEVGGLKRHQHTKLRQAVAEFFFCFIQQRHGIKSARLQPPLQAGMKPCKGAQPGPVLVTERFHVAQHHRRHVIAAGQFNLRDGFAGVQAGNQGA